MPEKSCSQCGLSASQVRKADPKAKLFYCGECLKIQRKVVYCSRNCQLEARSSHRPTCGKAISHTSSSSTSIPAATLSTPSNVDPNSSSYISRAVKATDSLWVIEDLSGEPLLLNKIFGGTEVSQLGPELRDKALATHAPWDVAQWAVYLAPYIEALTQHGEHSMGPGALVKQMEVVFGTSKKGIIDALPPLVLACQMAMFRPLESVYGLFAQLGGSYSSSSPGYGLGTNIFIPSPALARQCSALIGELSNSEPAAYFLFPLSPSAEPIPLATIKGNDEYDRDPG